MYQISGHYAKQNEPKMDYMVSLIFGNYHFRNEKTRVPSLGQEDQTEKGMATHSSLTLFPCGHKELDTTERLNWTELTHSSILAWRIPWIEAWWAEVLGVQRVGYDWVTDIHTHKHTHTHTHTEIDARVWRMGELRRSWYKDANF